MKVLGHVHTLQYGPGFYANLWRGIQYQFTILRRVPTSRFIGGVRGSDVLWLIYRNLPTYQEYRHGLLSAFFWGNRRFRGPQLRQRPTTVMSTIMSDEKLFHVGVVQGVLPVGFRRGLPHPFRHHPHAKGRHFLGV